MLDYTDDSKQNISEQQLDPVFSYTPEIWAFTFTKDICL